MNRGSLLLLAVVSACTTAQKTDQGPGAAVPSSPVTTLFITADLRGYIGPCGCSENMRGGIGRAAFQIAKAHDEGHPVIFIDSGNALFGKENLAPEAVPQQERKAKALAQAFSTMGLTGRAVGPLDDARGVEFRQSLGLTELQAQQFVTREIAVITVPNIEQARVHAARMKEYGAKFVIAVVQAPFEDTVPAIRQEGVGADLLIAALAKDELSTEENKLVGKNVRVAQVQSKGRSLLRVDVTIRGEAPKVEWLRGAADQERELSSLSERIELLRAQVNEPMLNEQLKALRKGKLEEIIARREALAAAPIAAPADHSSASARFIPLEASFPQLPAVKEIVTAYDRDVGLINVAYAEAHGRDCPSPEKGEAGVVGSAACLGCHPAAATFWQSTKHAIAYKTLQTEGKNNHLDCVGCHVTGWQKPGGVCRIDKTDGRTGVGCESCHGPGSLHVAAPTKATIARAVPAATCVGCHDRENAPHFAYDTYLEKIVGPGHGR